MDARAFKLTRLGLEEPVAMALVEAGLDSPAKIRAAKNKDLEAVKGIGEATRDKIRARFPERKGK